MISILMPLFNGKEFLKDSITSIKRQSYKDWELLICVNGHSEEEYNTISEHINSFDDERIKTIFTPAKGKVSALNLLKNTAKYDIICFIDADDYWFSEKLQKQLKFIDKYDVIGTDAAYFGEAIGTPGIFLGKITPQMFSFHNPIINSSVMIKKENAYWREEWEGLDDYYLWRDLLANNKTFYNVPEILVNHRIHHDSHYNIKNHEIKDKFISEMVKLSPEKYKELHDILESKEWAI